MNVCSLPLNELIFLMLSYNIFYYKLNVSEIHKPPTMEECVLTSVFKASFKPV